MNIRTFFNTVILLSIFAIPFFAHADWGGYSYQPNGPAPSIYLNNIDNVNNTAAEVGVLFDSNGAEYTWDTEPKIYVQYQSVYGGAPYTSEIDGEIMGSRTIVFDLENLQPGTQYAYTAYMQYEGMTYSSNTEYFTTTNLATNGPGPTTTSPSTPVTASNDTVVSSNDAIHPPSTSTAGADISNFFATVKQDAENSVETGGETTKDGVMLSITDSSARISEGDTFEYKIEYRNTNAKDLQNGKLAVILPPQYTFVESPYDSSFNEEDNTVTFIFGRIPANETKEISFTAKANTNGSGKVATVATLSYTGGSLSATDTDSYHSGSQAALGATVFGAGFFPQTFWGWLLIIVILTIVVILIRRYVKAAEKKKAEAAKK